MQAKLSNPKWPFFFGGGDKLSVSVFFWGGTWLLSLHLVTRDWESHWKFFELGWGPGV